MAWVVSGLTGLSGWTGFTGLRTKTSPAAAELDRPLSCRYAAGSNKNKIPTTHGHADHAATRLVKIQFWTYMAT